MKLFVKKYLLILIPALVLIGFLFFNKIKKALTKTEFVGNSTVAPLIDDVTAKSYADRLHRAMKGIGTDETETDKIFALIVGNNGNAQKVITAFGVRPYGVGGISLFDMGEKLPLKDWINAELSGQRLEKWNNLFASLGL